MGHGAAERGMLRPPMTERPRPIRARTVLPEGLEAGLLGGLIVVAIYLLRDLFRGAPLHTPSVLGAYLLYGAAAARDTISHAGLAAVWNGVHFAAWIAAGALGVRLLRRCEDDPRWRLAPGLALLGFLAVCFALDGWVTATELGRTYLWVGGFAGVAAMSAYLHWRHPTALGSA